ncbi:MAG: ABC transporter permease [Verrucomicrobiae bacterium]|nr:ABC transporter permease [Verrucomicrobiae bacterium]
MNDLRFAFRQLLRQPGFSALAAFSLALGIGLVATQFSLIDAILLRGFPIPDGQRLIHVSRLNPQTADPHEWETMPTRDYLALREQQTVLRDLAAVDEAGFNLAGPGRVASHHVGAQATANLTRLLGVAPQFGRWFDEEEDRPGAALRIVLSHGLWVEEFGSDPAIVGRPLTLNGEMGTVIGVMPARFRFPNQQRLWTNLRAAPTDPRESRLQRVEVVGILRRGISLEAARAELNGIAARLAEAYPETHRGYERLNVVKFAHAYAGGGTEPVLYLMLAMTGFILALACVNVANMLLARASRRSRELAVRASIGAGRWRLACQLLIEAVVLALAGSAGGLLIAWIGADQLQRHLFERMNVPGWFECRLDLRVVGIAALVSMAAGVAAGLVPAWQAGRVDVQAALKDECRGASSLGMGRFSRGLVTAQVGFSAMLLVAACVLGWTVFQTRQANLGYEPERLLSGRIELHDATHPEPADRARFYRDLMDRLAGEPGVEAVAVSSRNLVHPGVGTRVVPEGRVYAHENEQPRVWLEVVSNDYFRLLGVAPVMGRLFDSRERGNEGRTGLVNESFARQFWPDEEPAGRRFRSDQTQEQWVTVVGVVPDLQMQGLFSPPSVNAAGFYLAQEQMGWGWLNLLVRTRGDATGLAGPVRRAVASIDPDQPLHSIATLAEHTSRQVRGFTIVGVMAGIFAAITLFLGAVGVYGVTSYSVGQRTREFGVRMALGATVTGVLGLVLRQGARPIGIGLAGGLVAAFFITRPLQGVFGDEFVNSPLVYGAVVMVVGGVGLVALLVPARRAARVHPMEALRAE